MKRALSLVLAIAMMMSMAVTAFAAEAGSYEIADDVLLMGDNSLTMIEGVETTIFEFEPEEPGSYIFEIADANAKIGYWGGGRFFVSDQTENKSNKLEFKVNQAPGPSIMVGVSGVVAGQPIIVKDIATRRSKRMCFFIMIRLSFCGSWWENARPLQRLPLGEAVAAGD